MLSYSSLELRTGRWYNLVLFRNASTKEHIKSSETHNYAAHQLAPRYYEWIRLHNGIIPQGLAQCCLVLQTTKFYTFQGPGMRPLINEQFYQSMTLHNIGINSTIERRQVLLQLTSSTNPFVLRPQC